MTARDGLGALLSRPGLARTLPTTSQEPTVTTPADDGTRYCPAEFHGDDMFVGQLCERERGHDGEHEHLAVIEGTCYTRRLTWS